MANFWIGLRLTAGIFLLGTGLPGTGAAAPYTPDSGAQVLERLPTRNDPAQKALASLRSQLQRDPGNLAIATDLARRYISMARNDADPRYLGYAQAALASWWSQPNPPRDVLVLRATILQSTHRFTQALADLDLLLKTDPRNGQAWITRATVLQVQGEFEEARKSCGHLAGIAADLIVRVCLANVANLTGKARPSYEALRNVFESSGTADPSTQDWILTLLAEMAVRLGDTAVAEAHFRRALALSGTDNYLLGAFADFLLDQGRNEEVITLLKDRTRADGLLLRYALALNNSQSPAAAKSISELRDRFAAAALRGDTVHQREQSRFELQLMKNPKFALQLAQANWVVQKEPADARIYLEAAAASSDRTAAQPVLAWLKQTGLEDRSLDTLKKSLANPA